MPNFSQWNELLTLILAGVAVIGLIATMIAQYRWASPYREAQSAQLQAKEETINSLKEQLKSKDERIEVLHAKIETLKELNPTAVWEAYKYSKDMLLESNDFLKNNLEQSNLRLLDKEQKIENLITNKEESTDAINRLQEEANELKTKITQLEALKTQVQEIIEIQEKVENQVLNSLSTEFMPLTSENISEAITTEDKTSLTWKEKLLMAVALPILAIGIISRPSGFVGAIYALQKAQDDAPNTPES